MEDNELKTLAENIKRLRLDHGYTQREFGEAVGLSHAQICRIEKCVNGTEFKKLAKIAEVLGVEIIDLFM